MCVRWADRTNLESCKARSDVSHGTCVHSGDSSDTAQTTRAGQPLMIGLAGINSDFVVQKLSYVPPPLPSDSYSAGSSDVNAPIRTGSAKSLA